MFNWIKTKNTKQKVEIDKKTYTITSPIKGKVVDIKEVADPAFNKGELGKGVGIIPEKDKDDVLAPVSGIVSALFPTFHAIGLTTDQGVEVLIHIGIDTVQLEGDGFKAYVFEGKKVVRGEKLIEVDYRKLKDKGYDIATMIVITNADDYKEILTYPGTSTLSDAIIEIVI